jgi:putative intracellular protease/amidase
MSRLTRSFVYAAAVVVPPLAAAGLGVRELASRERPAPLAPMSAADIALAPRPTLDPEKPTVVVLLGADLTEITDAVGPYEMFARARRFNVVTAAPERQPTLLSGGLRILPHYSLAEIDSTLGGRAPAIVLVPNIPNIALEQNRALITWLQRQAATDAMIHSWCKGAMTLAHAGLLDGRTATAHWGDLPKLEKMYPQVRWVRGVRWIDHGQLVMSAGITSGIDASLHVIARLAGDSVGRRVARELRYPNYHYAIDPAATQYALQPADLVVAANAAYRVARPRIGIALYPGMNELDLSNVYDAHVYTAVADVETVAEKSGIVLSEHGLTLLPSLTLSEAEGRRQARELDRLVVPGVEGRARGASVVAATVAAAPSLRAEYLHADEPERFGLEPVLEDLARTSDAPTARFAQRRLEYRSAEVRFEGSAIPWGTLPLPLALAAAGLLLAIAIDRRLLRRGILALTAALVVAVAPAPAGSQSAGHSEARSLPPVATSTRVRVSLLAADSSRGFAPFARFRPDRTQPIIGTFEGSSGDTLFLFVGTGSDPLRIPRTAILDLHVSRGRPPRWEAALRGAVRPALVGAALGALRTSIRREDDERGPARVAVSSAALGAAWGAVRAAWSPRERWERVPVPVPSVDERTLARQ